MKHQSKRRIKDRLRDLWTKVYQFDWLHVLIVVLSLEVVFGVFFLFQSNSLYSIDSKFVLSNILTVNGVFSAILITYLFSRITWSKERKLETLKEAITLSQKITDFRRILNKITSYFNIWYEQASTKSLIDNGDFENIDYYDFKLTLTSDYEPKNKDLIEQLFRHENFKESHSTLYLAMVSLIRNRKNPRKEYPEELFNDFEHNGLYHIKAVEKWLEVGIFGTIWNLLDKNINYIRYANLRRHKDYILEAAVRINPKYKGMDLDNTLIKELANDFESHYLQELYIRLKELKKGVTDLNFLILSLITISLFFGVLAPIILLFINSNTLWYLLCVALLASINTGVILYFVLRFPTLIRNELKWL